MRIIPGVGSLRLWIAGRFAYFLGVIGAAVYYISNATGFGDGVIGFLKALVWPAFLVFKMFKFLGA